MIVLDASVLIAHFDPADPHHERATRLLDDMADEDVGASRVTLAEVLVGPAHAGRLHRACSGLRELAVFGIPMDADAPTRLATLRAETRLKLPDCCVLLAAEDTGAAAVATFDAKLATAARELGFDVPATG